jgi:hypothetical protein
VRLEPEVRVKCAGGVVEPDELEIIDGEPLRLEVAGEGGGQNRPGCLELQLGHAGLGFRQSAGTQHRAEDHA